MSLLSKFNPNAVKGLGEWTWNPDGEDTEDEDVVFPKKRPLETKENSDNKEDGEEIVQLKTSGDVEGEKIKNGVTKKTRRVFDESVLCNPDGLRRIYEEFPNACNFRGRGHEAQDIKRLISKYKEWAFQLYPNIAFPDMLNRLDSLGKKGAVSIEMEKLRDRERNRYLVEVLNVPLSEIRIPEREANRSSKNYEYEEEADWEKSTDNSNNNNNNNNNNEDSTADLTSPEAGGTPLTKNRVVIDDDDEDEDWVGAATATAAATATGSADQEEDEMDLDAMFAAAAEAEAMFNSTYTSVATAEMETGPIETATPAEDDVAAELAEEDDEDDEDELVIEDDIAVDNAELDMSVEQATQEQA